MPRIRYARVAEADLLELWLSIAEENLVAADEVLDSIQTTVLLLSSQPELGRVRPELADGLRSCPTRTQYIIFYLPEADGLMVVRVIHHARDVNDNYFS